MKPLIGMLAEVDDEQNTKLKYSYTKAIENSGGTPLILPYTENAETIDRFIELCDGFVFTGGVDISPERYGESKSELCGKPQLYRDELEFSFFAKVIKTEKPILGICRGMQFINVALGGTLYQDIPTEYKTDIKHRRNEGEEDITHQINVYPDSPLGALTKENRMIANSFHHQAIKKPGKGLEIMAMADDGIVEAVYINGSRYLRAYQWHPERLIDTDENNKLIFDDFINACCT